MGTEGGHYPGGSNVRPAQHEADGLALADGIVPLDANGNPEFTTVLKVLSSIGLRLEVKEEKMRAAARMTSP